ncbi:MAG: bifunctional glutamate N-acetyltransferase/amino-acid acetyltransferase ArgJ [Lachnospiraceae bacterium]|nr:bifunctional glutamate N-acetyltransferase/amino-acid acetyltransferase ArgJ [Lachnospiraceae bacterium]
MQKIEGGVTTPIGFLAAHTAAGIKYEDRDDMAMLFSTEPCELAGTFTKNVVKAAPVLWDRQRVEEGRGVRAVVVNAGIANACTGKDGIRFCEETAEAAADCLNIDPLQVCVASTGVIGMPLPMDRIKNGVRSMAPTLSDSREAANLAARAIMTTDTHPKEAAVCLSIHGTEVRIGGMTKGSGMIHPNMGTMLSFITTDAAISKELLQEALSQVVSETYNMISVDGDTSTNDTCLLMANGLAKNEPISKEDDSFSIFVEGLLEVNRTLARMMAGDGEGATALIEAVVKGAPDKEGARKLAKSVITSSLTKAAIYGHDANWGRIMCALGYAGVEFDPERVDITIKSEAGELPLVENGVALSYSETEASEILSKSEVQILCDIHAGDQEAVAWGCDLTYEYVKINADYRS